MSYLVIVFADNLQIFSFDLEEDAARHAEEWWAAFPDIKTVVAEVTSENIVSGDLTEWAAAMRGKKTSLTSTVNQGNLDLLACLEHLVTEGGIDNFLEASRGEVGMEFTAGRGASGISWKIDMKKNLGHGRWGDAQGTELVQHQFVHEVDGVHDVDRYSRKVRAENFNDLLAITREACAVLREVFGVQNEQDWHFQLCLQYYDGG